MGSDIAILVCKRCMWKRDRRGGGLVESQHKAGEFRNKLGKSAIQKVVRFGIFKTSAPNLEVSLVQFSLECNKIGLVQFNRTRFQFNSVWFSFLYWTEPWTPLLTAHVPTWGNIFKGVWEEPLEILSVSGYLDLISSRDRGGTSSKRTLLTRTW